MAYKDPKFSLYRSKDGAILGSLFWFIRIL